MGDIIFRMIVMVFVCLSIVGCNKSEIDRLQKENVQLKKQAQSLQTEITKLKETADFHFQSGVDNFNSKNYTEAEANFQNVVEKYPDSYLVKNARAYLVKTKKMIAEEEKLRKVAEERERRKREEIERLQGTPINYITFYSKAKGSGLPVGKRYRFKAYIDKNYSLTSDGKSSHLLIYDKDIDEDCIPRVEQFYRSNEENGCFFITVTLGWNGRTYIRRIE